MDMNELWHIDTSDLKDLPYQHKGDLTIKVPLRAYLLDPSWAQEVFHNHAEK